MSGGVETGIMDGDGSALRIWTAGSSRLLMMSGGSGRKMRIIESCAECLFDKQQRLSDDPDYLREIREIIENRSVEDSAPYLVYLFGKVYEKHFGPKKPYAGIKRKYNDLVLSREAAIRKKIEASEDPLRMALGYARAGNYIDFGAMNVVQDDEFLKLLNQAELKERDQSVMDSLLRQCETARNFLLLADNCGEIVLDKLFIEQLLKRFPHLRAEVMVRGSEVLNDATEEDAVYSGIDRVAQVISNGNTVAGTVYNMLSEKAKNVLDSADIILSKGQGNYETLNGQGRHIFYAFLCKCDLFTSRFDVPRLTGILVEENGAG